MPIHDWTRVEDGIFHDFHQDWIQSLKHALNRGLLPPPFYAISEQTTRPSDERLIPDVLALEYEPDNGKSHIPAEGQGGLLIAPPHTAIVAETDVDVYRLKQNRVAIRHSSDDRVVAVIEVVSAGNKSSRQALEEFLNKSVTLLFSGIHLLIIDLHPPTSRDRNGIHGAIWEEIGNTLYEATKPLTVAAYQSGSKIRAYVEPLAVGDQFPAMPLYLRPDGYVNVPLEDTYMATWREIPARWREVIEATP